MNNKNRVSQLTLELYYRGLATRKERKQVEKALKTNIEVQSRYKAIAESEREAHRLYSEELYRLNIQETPPAAAPRKKRIVTGFVLAAAILLCAIIPAFLYLKASGSNKNNAITEGSAEETANEIDTQEETEDKTIDDKALSPEQPVRRERGSSNEKTGIAESPRREPTAEQELRPGGTEIAVIPEPDTGVRLRGAEQTKDQNIPEEPPNINIPPGISFIFENMFVNRNLTFVIIPSRITSIAKNAFAGNPLLSVTIGANVTVDDNAIPGNFAAVYNANNKAAGTYTRPDTNSEAWGKK
jgi:hypothetical protein